MYNIPYNIVSLYKYIILSYMIVIIVEKLKFKKTLLIIL